MHGGMEFQVGCFGRVLEKTESQLDPWDGVMGYKIGNEELGCFKYSMCGPTG